MASVLRTITGSKFLVGMKIPYILELTYSSLSISGVKGKKQQHLKRESLRQEHKW